MQTGTIGGPIYNNSPNGWWLEYTESLWNYVKFQVDGDELYFESINADGDVVDSFRMYADGTYQTAVDEQGREIPASYQLSQNYPNPFNPSTSIRYALPEVSDIRLTIFDVKGREVKSWELDSQAPGSYSIQWNGTDNFGLEVSAGMYFTRLQAGTNSYVIKMVYLQ